MRQNVLILVHSGVYKAEFLVIDSNVTILGAGKFRLTFIMEIQSANCLHILEVNYWNLLKSTLFEISGLLHSLCTSSNFKQVKSRGGGQLDIWVQTWPL